LIDSVRQYYATSCALGGIIDDVANFVMRLQTRYRDRKDVSDLDREMLHNQLSIHIGSLNGQLCDIPLTTDYKIHSEEDRRKAFSGKVTAFNAAMDDMLSFREVGYAVEAGVKVMDLDGVLRSKLFVNPDNRNSREFCDGLRAVVEKMVQHGLIGSITIRYHPAYDGSNHEFYEISSVPNSGLASLFKKRREVITRIY